MRGRRPWRRWGEEERTDIPVGVVKRLVRSGESRLATSRRSERGGEEERSPVRRESAPTLISPGVEGRKEESDGERRPSKVSSKAARELPNANPTSRSVGGVLCLAVESGRSRSFVTIVIDVGVGSLVEMWRTSLIFVATLCSDTRIPLITLSITRILRQVMIR